MKTKLILSFCTLLVVLIPSCKDEPTEKEIFIKDISKTWTPSTTGIVFKGQPVNGVFNSFSLTFGKGQTYTTTDGQNPVWRASGKYTVQNATNSVGFEILRDDGVIVTVDQLTDTKLVLKFDYTGGRSRSVSGGYIFDLVSQ
jgi:hypothetical protein